MPRLVSALLHVGAALALIAVLAEAAAWSVPVARATIWWVALALMAATVVRGVGQGMRGGR